MTTQSKETVFERIQRSVPVNKITALQMAHTADDVWASELDVIIPRYVLLDKRNGHLTQAGYSNWDRALLVRLQQATWEEAKRLNTPIHITHNRPRSMEYYGESNGIGVFKLRLRLGTLSCTERCGKLFFRHQGKGYYHVYRDGEKLISEGTAEQLDISNLFHILQKCVELAPANLKQELIDQIDKHKQSKQFGKKLTSKMRRLINLIATIATGDANYIYGKETKPKQESKESDNDRNEGYGHLSQSMSIMPGVATDRRRKP